MAKIHTTKITSGEEDKKEKKEASCEFITLSPLDVLSFYK